MKALVYQGAKTLKMEERADLSDTEDEVVIDVDLCGICGSDMHAFLGHDARRPAPLIFGHEAAGIERSTGRRVTVNPLQACDNCDACSRGLVNICPNRKLASMPPREGGFAGSMLARRENLVEIPDDISFAKAALTEPLACGWHGVLLGKARIDRPLEEATCTVLGGGTIGLGAALVLAAHGARDIWIAETNPVRQQTLKNAGDFKIFDPSKGEGPGEDSTHLVIDAVGIDATRASSTALAKPGGAIVHIGLGDGASGLDIRRMTLQEISFTGSYTYTLEEFRDTARAIFDGRLGNLDWMELRPIEDGQSAFDDILAGKVAAPKIILTT